jgi:pentose-5-phosphate-3-epimerase
LQGGISIETVAEAARLGADFLVSGTEIFRKRNGLRAPEVIDRMFEEAARGLAVR